MKHKQIGTQFALGVSPANIPDGSNVRVEPARDSDDFEAYILSYGWAVVFARRPDGSVVEFAPWSDYSASTATQMGKIRRGVQSDTTADFETDDRQPVHGSANNLNHRVRRVDGPTLG